MIHSVEGPPPGFPRHRKKCSIILQIIFRCNVFRQSAIILFFINTQSNVSNFTIHTANTFSSLRMVMSAVFLLRTFSVVNDPLKNYAIANDNIISYSIPFKSIMMHFYRLIVFYADFSLLITL